MKFFVLKVIAFLIYGNMAFAGVTTAKIERVLLYERGNLVYVFPTGGVKNPPTCHGSNGNYYSFRLDRPASKQTLAMLMVAQATEKSVTIWGTGSCADQPFSETLDYLALENF